MGLFDFFKSSSKEKENLLQEKEVNQVKIKEIEVGSYGQDIYAGEINEEYLEELIRTQGAKEFDIMRRSDYQTRMLLSVVKNPIKNAIPDIESASDSDEDLKIKRVVEFLLFENLDQKWSKLINEVLTALEFGSSYFEKIHASENKPIKLEGQTILSSFTTIKSLKWRSPKTIEQYNVDEKGNLESITQWSDGDLQVNAVIPSYFLVNLIINPEGADYQGMSLLRPIYGNYKRKNLLLKTNIIGAEKFANPIPVAEPAENGGKTDIERVRTFLKQYCSHQNAYLIAPSGWNIKLHNSDFDPSKLDFAIDSEDKRATKAFLANFLELAMGGNGGAYSLGKDLSDFFLGSIKYIGKLIEDMFNYQVIPELVKLNFGEKESYPKLRLTGIDDQAGIELAQIFNQLSTSGYVRGDDELEKHIRKRFGLPKVDEETIRTNSTPPGPIEPQDTLMSREFNRWR